MTNYVKADATTTDSLYLALVQCFAVVLCGYVAGRLGVIRRSEANGLNTFVGTFALPALIFLSLAKLDLDSVNWRFLLAVTLAKSCVFFTVLIVSMIITKPLNFGRSALFAIFTTQSNDFAIGYPMINALYGSTHPEYSAYLYLMAPISLAILNPIGFVLLEFGKRRNEEQGTGLSLFTSTVKGIVLNPVLFMTVLGLLGNFVFGHEVPRMLAAVLDVFGNAFSASALFLLGLMMVGKVYTLKGVALVIPGILILIKLLVLPLIIRESVILLDAGQNSTDTRDLSTYGFLYGTIPTAPALFVFTLRYNLDIDLIASAMVACTFLSAPLMFVSAKMISAVCNGVTPSDYVRQINAFSFDISVISTAACVWLLICFFFLKGKKYKNLTHRCTLCLVIAQLTAAIGVIIWTKLEAANNGSPLWYVQFVLITGGIYASRLWTAALAATLLFLNCRSLSFARDMQKWFFPIGWGGPFLIVSLMCFLVTPGKSVISDHRNPNFQLGKIQAAVSVFVLLFCFVVTLGCLILQQRYQHRSRSAAYTTLITPTTSRRISNGRNVVDVEDLISPITNTPTINCELNNGCSSDFCAVDEGREHYEEDSDSEAEMIRSEEGDPQSLRHLVLLILLLCSMFVGLSLSVSTLVMEQVSGIYVELTFLDIALNFGQSLIAFAIFGLDPGFGTLGHWLQRVCNAWYAGKELQLPNENALSAEARAIRDQFARCHLAECRARISMCRRRLLRVYNGAFAGSDLVNWLLEAGVAQNREEAVWYGRCLLDSRVLHHVDGTHHFHDRNLLYTFRA